MSVCVWGGGGAVGGGSQQQHLKFTQTRHSFDRPVRKSPAIRNEMRHIR